MLFWDVHVTNVTITYQSYLEFHLSWLLYTKGKSKLMNLFVVELKTINFYQIWSKRVQNEEMLVMKTRMVSSCHVSMCFVVLRNRYFNFREIFNCELINFLVSYQTLHIQR